MKQIFLACALSAAFISTASAQVTVKDPWIRATVPAAKASGAFMQLQSAQDVRLVEARTPVAGSAELHQMSMKDNRMMMSPVDSIELPAGKPVALASGGYHIMLMQLKQQMKEGSTVPLTLVFEGKDKKRSQVEVQVPVKPLSYSPHAGH
ncbi:copper chaperone PCu(A)C [Massilia sp. SM-13]|uniref:copper chaperone PCu(A)C n=1 Tax=Pseudoduganella rhizocola TaxID=3382643 RepID=UPI0038B5A9E3